MSQTSPFSVVRELSAATLAQFRGSLSGNGFAHDRAAYRVGLKVCNAATEIGFAVIPTHTSPLRINWRWATAQPMLMSNRFDGFNISTMTLPLKWARCAGRRTSTRVVYGAFGVRMTAGPEAGHV